MRFLPAGILYRRVVWKPNDSGWWKEGLNGDYYPQRQAIGLTKLAADKRPRLDEQGKDIVGKAGQHEEGLSCTYSSEPSAREVYLAAKGDSARNRVIGFTVSEILAIGLDLRWDPVRENSEQYDAQLGEVLSHTLILATERADLFKAPFRQSVIDVAWEIDQKTGQLRRRYIDLVPPLDS